MNRDDIFQIPRRWSPEEYGDRCFYYDVFVSHSNGDESDELVEALRRHDIRVWYDKHQDMVDARWSTRIVWGLQSSCILICFVGSQPLEQHAWVQTEINAGRLAAEAAGFERVLVVHAGTKQEVPSWLVGSPIALRYFPGGLDDGVVQQFAAGLRDRNRVAIGTSSPPFAALMRRAREVGNLRKNPIHNPKQLEAMSDIDFLEKYTAEALQEVAQGRSVDEIKDGSVACRLLYLVRVASDGLWPPAKQPIDGADGIALRFLADDLGLLASLPELSPDSRGFAYVALGRLAEAGVTHAFEVLRTCLRWEWEDALIAHVASILARYPQHRDRDDALLTLLKSERFFNSWPLELLAEPDSAVRLKHHARRLRFRHLRLCSELPSLLRN